MAGTEINEKTRRQPRSHHLVELGQSDQRANGKTGEQDQDDDQPNRAGLFLHGPAFDLSLACRALDLTCFPCLTDLMTNDGGIWKVSSFALETFAPRNTVRLVVVLLASSNVSSTTQTPE